VATSGLIPLVVFDVGRKLSGEEQLTGLSANARAVTNRIAADTAQGHVEIYHADRRVHVELANGVCAEAGPVSGAVAVAEAKRGLRGELGRTPLVIRRPRFGLRLASRSAHFDAGAIHLRSHMSSPRRFVILRGADEVVLAFDRGRTEIEVGLAPEEVVATLLFQHCGIIQGSSLVNLFVV